MSSTSRFYFDLSTARDNVFVPVDGHTILGFESSEPSALVAVQVKERQGVRTDAFDVKNQGGIKFTEHFEGFYISNAAQANVSITLLVINSTVAPADFEYWQSQQVSVDTITQPVMTTGGADASQTVSTLVAATATKAITAAAGITGWEIYNPAINTASVWVGFDNTVTNSGATMGREIMPGQSWGWDTRSDVWVYSDGTPTILTSLAKDS